MREGTHPRARRLSAGAVLTLAVGLLGAVAGCGGEEPATREPKDVRATVGEVTRAEIPRTVSATGSLQGENTAQISTRMMGWVTDVMVEEDQSVAKGQPLVRIDDTDLQARKHQAEASIREARAVLDNAETNVGRFEQLYADKSVSRSQLDDVRTGRDRAAAALARAEAGLREVEVQLSYLDIKAPAAGTVARRLVDPGDMASPGQPLLTLEQTGRMKVTAALGERDINDVAAGDTITVEITSLPDAVHRVPVARVVPAANPMSRTYDVEAYVDNPRGRLKSGMFARVLVPVGERTAVLAPRAAVITHGQLTGVWVVDEAGTARLRWIRLGRDRGDRVEVLSGLQGGESVVLEAEQPLVEGDRVVR